MAGAHTKNHDYHLVDPSPWPLVGAASATIMAMGAVMWMKAMSLGGMKLGPLIFGVGMLGVLYTMLAWWMDVVREAEHEGHHTRVVQIHHRYGMLMFIASEVMFFVAWFWAYFDASLFPARRSTTPARSSPAASGRPRASPPSTPGTCRCSTR
jgi:cytochrome c oxidase subunit 3